MPTFPPSRCLTFDDAANIVEAAGFAHWHLGRPLNRFITIRYDGPDIPEHWRKVHNATLKRLQQWVAHYGLAWCAAWVLERDVYGRLHVHLVAHIPDDLATDAEMKRRINGWLKDHHNGKPARDTVDVQTIGQGRGGYSLDELRNVLGYMLKALHQCDTPVRTTVNGRTYFDRPADLFNGSPERRRQRALEHPTGLELRIRDDKGSQGIIQGKRCGTSEAISHKARDTHYEAAWKAIQARTTTRQLVRLPKVA